MNIFRWFKKKEPKVEQLEEIAYYLFSKFNIRTQKFLIEELWQHYEFSPNWKLKDEMKIKRDRVKLIGFKEVKDEVI